MSRKQRQYAWSGCEDCNILQKKNEEKSNENWSVYDCSHPCPKCGKEMHFIIGEPPEDAIQEDKWQN